VSVQFTTFFVVCAIVGRIKVLGVVCSGIFCFLCAILGAFGVAAWCNTVFFVFPSSRALVWFAVHLFFICWFFSVSWFGVGLCLARGGLSVFYRCVSWSIALGQGGGGGGCMCLVVFVLEGQCGVWFGGLCVWFFCGLWLLGVLGCFYRSGFWFGLMGCVWGVCVVFRAVVGGGVGGVGRLL